MMMNMMHDMHTNTMHHAWCNAWYKGNTQPQCTNMQKQTKKQKKCYEKHTKMAISHTTMAFKKTMATLRDERKGGPNTVRDPLK